MKWPGWRVKWYAKEDEFIADMEYHDARREHAFLLRCEGVKYKEIGQRLGVRKQAAHQLVMRFGKRLNKAMRRLRR
jgi:DNA-directed RNA polymerase specialized sigma24 family protein